jgi:hypothetical protein
MRTTRFVASCPWWLKRRVQQSCAVSEGYYWYGMVNSSTEATGVRKNAVGERRERDTRWTVTTTNGGDNTASLIFSRIQIDNLFCPESYSMGVLLLHLRKGSVAPCESKFQNNQCR